MKILFFCQSEGNGHLTQSLAVKEILEKKYPNCEIKFYIGNNTNRPESPLVKEYSQVGKYDSFNFVYKDGKLSLLKTALKILSQPVKIVKNILNIRRILKIEKPDKVFNFFEPIIGLAMIGFRKSFQLISVGRQFYLSLTDTYSWPQKQVINLTAFRSDLVLAANYFEDNIKYKKNWVVVSPILRDKVLNTQPGELSNRNLIYLIDRPSLAEIDELTESNKVTAIFSSFNSYYELRDTLRDKFIFLNKVSDKFNDWLMGCSKVTCSAGFETTSEALYLGKTLLLKPIPNHSEQLFNTDYLVSKGLASNYKDFDFKPDKIKLKEFQDNVQLTKEKLTNLI